MNSSSVGDPLALEIVGKADEGPLRRLSFINVAIRVHICAYLSERGRYLTSYTELFIVKHVPDGADTLQATLMSI